MRGMWERACLFGRCSVVAGFVGALTSAGAAAQIPGGRTTDFDAERATFRAAVLDQVLPVMDSWQSAWHEQGSASVGSYYLDDAALALPGGSMIAGREGIATFTDSARNDVVDLNTSMLDFAATDNMAFVYGTWTAAWADGTAEAVGQVVTVMGKARGQWQIRFQLFGADSLSPDRALAAARATQAPPIADRVVVPTWIRPESPASRSNRRDALQERRTSAYHAFLADLASLRRAWNADDAGAMKDLLRDDGWVCLPGRGSTAGRVSEGDLKKALKTYGTLNTAEVDFETTGGLGYLSGRYYVPVSGGPARSGFYLALFQNMGSDWHIRALVFL